MRSQIVLTVSESKRLIAKGILASDIIKAVMASGTIIVASGSTNAYIAEELTGKAIDKERYLTGHTLPAKFKKEPGSMTRIPPFVFKDGELVSDLDWKSALQSMKEGDVFIKGANAINYTQGVAGVLVGDSSGGTIGAAMGHVIGKRLHLLIPAGLEKCVAFDIDEISRTLAESHESNGNIPRMMAVRGHLFTEIEALAALVGVRAVHIASGGIGGAEGGVRLLLEGEEASIAQAKVLIQEIQGEPPFFSI